MRVSPDWLRATDVAELRVPSCGSPIGCSSGGVAWRTGVEDVAGASEGAKGPLPAWSSQLASEPPDVDIDDV